MNSGDWPCFWGGAAKYTTFPHTEIDFMEAQPSVYGHAHSTAVITSNVHEWTSQSYSAQFSNATVNPPPGSI